jgi:hypothetical protein
MKTKNLNFPTEDTHTPTLKMLQELGITEPTFYKDVKYLGIELIKDEDNHSWISNEDKSKVLGLRNHIKETGRRAGFDPEKVEDLIIEETPETPLTPETAVQTPDIIEETPETLEITMTDKHEPTTTESTELATTEPNSIATTESNGITTTESGGLTSEDIYEVDETIYIEPEEETANFNRDLMIRAGAKLKSRELATPHLLKRAIADEFTEETLPEDLRRKVQLAREAANPKYTPKQIAKALMDDYRKKLAG